MTKPRTFHSNLTSSKSLISTRESEDDTSNKYSSWLSFSEEKKKSQIQENYLALSPRLLCWNTNWILRLLLLGFHISGSCFPETITYSSNNHFWGPWIMGLERRANFREMMKSLCRPDSSLPSCLSLVFNLSAGREALDS